MKNADMPAMPLTNENGAPLHFSAAGMDNDGVMFGLTKREMMAMHALQGLLSGTVTDELVVGDEKGFAEAAVDYADALLAALEEKQ